MSDSITISKKTPDSKSQQYDFLREEGIKYIQSLAGKIWTDYNIHDPGVTILEVLSYAITELGYRASYDIKDLLAIDPNDKNAADIRNFFTAREILPNTPVTINDYRKLLIDVDAWEPLNENCQHVGIKNAWLEKSKSNEIPVYVHKSDSELSYEPDPSLPSSGQLPLEIGILYDILLEFEKCDEYGDLNENSIAKTLVINEHLPDTNVEGLEIKIDVEFPRWDSEDTDWEDVVSVKSDVSKITIRFSNVPDNYDFSYELVNNVVKLKGTITSASDIVDVPGLALLEDQINDFIYYSEDSLLAFYLQKIGKIKEIIEEVKKRLHANRNLCEDFYKLSALKVEKIAVCADIELEQEADVETVQAKIYHEIGKFLSPTVYFYTLDEMLDKCKQLHELNILEIDANNRYFTVDEDLEEILYTKNTLTIADSRSNDGDYTVKSIHVDADSITTKIYVEEEIPSALLTENETLSFYTTNEEECLTVDEIFEGPALEHGFIDNNELEKADRKKSIHVSDLIQIIMDIDGVTAVKTIQIANIPQDNEDGSIESKSVKWCLQLAFEQNYVPRLSTLDSKITFFKDQLPFKASSTVVDGILYDLEQEERVPKLINPKLDFDVPRGNYKDLESYESIQNEFPLTYGIGDEGLPAKGNNLAANLLREAKASQLKGFLMQFDQLFANYFSQLAHVKDLFSMNAEKDEFGNYVIGRTYYTQPLFDIVPNAEKLYVDKNGHAVALNNIAEDEVTFLNRKNKFLDHLIGRFAEKFTDYAMLTYKLSGDLVGKEDLIEDKLAFLNAYPAISSERGKGFDHQEQCKLWHVDNISGLRQRTSFLAGIDETESDDLIFSPQLAIVPSGDDFVIQISNGVPELLLKSFEPWGTEEEAKLALEKMVLNGLVKENYQVLSEDGSTNFYFTLDCGGYDILGISERENYPDDFEGGELDQDIDELVDIFRNEFFGNAESNRNNLSCPLLNYIQYSISTNMVQDPPAAEVNYELFANAFSTDSSDKILEGKFTVAGSSKSEVDIISVDTVTKQLVVDGNIAEKLAAGDIVVIENSQDNDGSYEVVSATDVAGTTEIVVVEPIPSNLVPLGELLFNNETSSELQQKAENQISDLFWQLIKNASQQEKYYFSDESGNYRFRVIGDNGDDIGESTEADFNDFLADEINNLVSGVVQIDGSPANDGEYQVVSASASGPDVSVTVIENLPTTEKGGNLSFTESFTYSTDLENNALLVSSNLSGKLFAGDEVIISGSESNDGAYTVFSIDFAGTETTIVVEEPIAAEDSTGLLSYSKSFVIDKVVGKTITFKGAYDEKTVDLFIEFILEKFFSHEGFHVLEHVLLRPKVKGDHFIDADSETLTEGLSEQGSVYYNKSLPLFSASEVTNQFIVEDDLSADLDSDESTDISSEILISGTGTNDALYQVKGVQYNGGTNRTTVKTKESVPTKISALSPVGTLSFMKGTPINSLSASSKSLTISEPEILDVVTGEIVEIRGSTDETNNGKYVVDQIIDNGASQEIVIARIESWVEDKLLEIVLDDDDCDTCQIQDPYTCIASVILPHWQGRFDNMDFRRFFERQLRLEAPAHVFLNICWISCEQMTEFENKYKTWLIENAKKQKDYGKLSARLNELIDIVSELRNVYPSGTLHDCEEDETLENAIILDNSVLGNA